MGRWDIDDATRSPDRTSANAAARRGVTGRDHTLEITSLPVRVSSRSRDELDGARGHGLTLPEGREREVVLDQGRTYQLRGSEVDLLECAGRFRVTFTEDLKQGAGDAARFRDDLRSLKEQGLIAERSVTRLKDGTVADVVSVTTAGKALLNHHRDPERDRGQVYYAGWVKPAEVWHDASLFRMVREVEHELEGEGSRVRRVVLDDELKATAYRAMHEARSKQRTKEDAHWIVAKEYRLHLDRDRFVFPDVRLEVEDRDGTVRTVDLELVTEHYHRGHLGGKAGAGFRMFGGSSGAARGGTPHDPRAIEKLLR